MAKAKKAAPAKKEIERIELGNGNVLVKYDDGTWAIITVIPAEVVESLVGTSEEDDDEEDDDEEDDDEEDDDEEEVTPEVLAGADFEELEDICDDKNLDTDPDDFDEDEVEKLRAAVAKELGIKLPKKSGKKGKK
nr:MAG TPA: DNA polymerase phi [Caudoviricetes sp.]